MKWMKQLPGAVQRFLRTAIQLVAGGGLTALVAALAGGLTPTSVALIMGGWTAFVTLSQNLLEDHTRFPTILKSPVPTDPSYPAPPPISSSGPAMPMTDPVEPPG